MYCRVHVYRKVTTNRIGFDKRYRKPIYSLGFRIQFIRRFDDVFECLIPAIQFQNEDVLFSNPTAVSRYVTSQEFRRGVSTTCLITHVFNL